MNANATETIYNSNGIRLFKSFHHGHISVKLSSLQPFSYAQVLKSLCLTSQDNQI
jgi:hypothetical protein